jgi:hypothetical protein
MKIRTPRANVPDELRRIEAKYGLLRAADVVEEASLPGSPLHNCFEWDDGAAGYQWRLQQARQLIRVTVEMLPYDEPRYEVRAFVSLTPDRVVERGGYRVMTEVLASPSEREQLLADALKELNRLKVKYFQLSELSAVFRAIERAQQNYGQAPPPPSGSGGDEART